MTTHAARGLLVLSAVMSTVGRTASASDLTLSPLGEKLQMNGAPLIVNGEPADPGEYPVSFQGGMNKDDICTWFLVSARTLVGAAHCVAGTAGKLNIVANKIPYSASCDLSKGYPKDPSQDWALCLLSSPYIVPRSPTIPVSGYEVLNFDDKKIAANPRVEIGGYGCTQANGPVSTTYQFGAARVAIVPPYAHVSGSTRPTPNAIEMRGAPATLCGGDSGGPAFLYPQGGRIIRVVIGINSSTAVGAGESFFASTSTSDAKAFFESWAKTNRQRLCGLHSDAQGCRPLSR